MDLGLRWKGSSLRVWGKNLSPDMHVWSVKFRTRDRSTRAYRRRWSSSSISVGGDSSLSLSLSLFYYSFNCFTSPKTQNKGGSRRDVKQVDPSRPVPYRSGFIFLRVTADQVHAGCGLQKVIPNPYRQMHTSSRTVPQDIRQCSVSDHAWHYRPLQNTSWCCRLLPYTTKFT